MFFPGGPDQFHDLHENNSQDLTPIAKVVWGITAWRRDTFLALADAGACGVFAGRLGLFPVPLEESLDIDTPAQWHLAECLLAARTGRPEPASYWEVPRTECTCTPAVAGRSHPGDSTMPTDRLRNLAAQAREIIAKHVTVLRERDVAADVLREEGKDITLRADRLLSDALTAGLTAATGIACLSEEDRDGLGLPDDQAVWIVDPLDGSMNYSRGLPLYGISIALWQGGTPLLGIIRDVCRGETLTGFSDGSDVDGVPLAVRQETDMGRAMLATGFPVLTDTSPEATDWLRSFVGRFKKIRMLGSAALSLAWVAQGKIDAYFERDIMLWDVAAGAALVRGAGGRLRHSPRPPSHEPRCPGRQRAPGREHAPGARLGVMSPGRGLLCCLWGCGPARGTSLRVLPRAAARRFLGGGAMMCRACSDHQQEALFDAACDA